MVQVAIQAKQLRLKFPGEQRLVFQDLNLGIMEQEKVLIVGPSGSGKSTLLQVLSGIIPAYYPIPVAYEEIVIPKQWGIVFQDPDTQFCMSYVDEELAFVLENRSIATEQMDDMMKAVLDQVGLKLPNLHTPISSLSQGMKQRLSLASILLLEPTTVFLDEPSALLDPEGKKQIWESLRNTLQHHTVVVVEHDIDGILDWFDRVIVLDSEGQIMLDKPPAEIFQKHKDLLQAYGIWHPDSWHSFLNKQAIRTQLTQAVQPAETVIRLEQFKVHRGSQLAVYIEQATVMQGSWIAITGENGAGKSSLMLALAKLLESTGTYILNGQSLNDQASKKQKKQQLPNELSFVFQSPELQFIADTVLDEMLLSYADPAISFRKFAKREKENYRPAILDQLQQFQLPVPLDRHPYQCSVGQKKRLSLLTAFINNGSILLLDEPTFGQDATNTFTILETLLTLQKQGVTIVMITHDPIIAKNFATEQWHLANGALQAITNNQLQQGGAYAAQLAELAYT